MFEKLLEYQKVDAKLKAIDDELHQSEEFKKYAQANRFLKTVADSKAQIDDRAKSLMSLMTELTEKYKKLADEKSEFDDALDAQEESTLGFLKKKSAELGAKLASVESEIVSLKNNIDELMEQFKKLSVNRKKMMEQREEYGVKYKALVESKEQEKAEIIKELAAIEKDVPKEYLEKYKEKRKDNKFPIVYEVKIEKNGTHCSGCGTELSIYQIDQLKKNKMIECENCRKLIFIND